MCPIQDWDVMVPVVRTAKPHFLLTDVLVRSSMDRTRQRECMQDLRAGRPQREDPLAWIRMLRTLAGKTHA